MTRQEKAVAQNQKAFELKQRGRLREAIRHYEKAMVLAPDWSVPPFNLGLLFKEQRLWQKSLQYSRLATAVDPDNKAAWWNMGIAATALGRWKAARAAWRGFGIDLPDGDGPPDLPCGFNPIRLNPDSQAEVVWAQRIDPARAVLDNIPFPESGHCWRDVVLTDGAPNGYRRHDGKDIPVFDELELLEPSLFGTYVARIALPERGNPVSTLTRLAAEMGGNAEDWTTSTRILCKACSEGRPHKAHDTEAAPPDGVHVVGIAARHRDHATEILSAWETGAKGVCVESLDEGLEPGRKKRGKGHAPP